MHILLGTAIAMAPAPPAPDRDAWDIAFQIVMAIFLTLVLINLWRSLRNRK